MEQLCSLAQIAKIEYKFEDGLIWHRNRLPTITVRADIRTNLQPATVVGELAESMDMLRAELPRLPLLKWGEQWKSRHADKVRSMPVANFFGSGHDITHDSAEEFVSGNNCSF